MTQREPESNLGLSVPALGCYGRTLHTQGILTYVALTQGRQPSSSSSHLAYWIAPPVQGLLYLQSHHPYTSSLTLTLTAPPVIHERQEVEAREISKTAHILSCYPWGRQGDTHCPFLQPWWTGVCQSYETPIKHRWTGPLSMHLALYIFINGGHYFPISTILIKLPNIFFPDNWICNLTFSNT